MISKILTLTTILLYSCSTLKEEDCNNRDWYIQGQRDGAKGYTKEMYATYLNVCAQKKAIKTEKDYLRGHQEGAIRYCTYDKGFLVGESGRPYPSVCPPKTFPKFQKGFNKGQKKTLK